MNRFLFIAICFSGMSQNLSADEAGFDDDSANTIVVTSTREQKLRSELPESVVVVDEEALKAISPSHPAEVLNRIPGVHINNLGGEGHMSSIRQPITTAGVYLFLEDGVPTRPSGFFNHNGLYEINVPQSSRIEVIKGTGSALYGSDAIGGIINSMTKPSPDSRELEASLEVGSHGWKRGLFSAGDSIDANSGFRFDLNITDNEGYREESDYSRASTTLRYDNQLNDNWNSKTVFAFSQIEQSGVSSLEEEDYLNNPKKNRFHSDIGFREVDALRLSAEFNYSSNESELWTLIPFYRDNQMKMMPSWMVTYDPNIRDYEFQSYGMLIKYRNQLNENVELITGLDFESTPSSYREEAITVVLEDDIYTDYSPTGNLNYDFDAKQNIISAYAQFEWKISTEWLLSIGGRFDDFEVDYDDNIAAQAVDPSHIRPLSQTVDFDNFSPKFGLIYYINDSHNIYFNRRDSFVAPSVGRLFRPGSSLGSENLKPVQGESTEIGFRGNWNQDWRYELAIYDLQKKDDLVSIIDGADRRIVNAGETSHQGIEVGLQGQINSQLVFNFAWTKTRQEYEEFAYLFQCFSPACGRQIPGPPIRENRNFAGFDIGKAPESLGNISLEYYPEAIEGARFELELEHVGEYFTDETNTQKYDGHDLFNFRASYPLSEKFKLNFRAMNLTDERYSTYTSNQVGDPDISYRPGLPRSYYLNVSAEF